MTKKSLFVVGVGLIVFTSIKTAEAGFLSKNVQKQAVFAYNSQNISLLEALPGGTTSLALGGGDTTIVGGSAFLPESGPAGTIVDIVEGVKNNGQISVYIVREGDSLSEIAEMFDVSVNTILWSNDLKKGSALKPGQTLTILPISGVRYTVKKGDTLASVAKKYNGNADEIIRYNDLDTDGDLAIGSIIIIPNGQIPVETKTSGTAVVKKTSPARGTGVPEYAGYYLRPIVGGVKTQGIHGYNAVDLAASAGTPVMASAGGTVVVASSGSWNGGYGNYVVIAHSNGTQTLYSHLQAVSVVRGQTVAQGDVIGSVGSTGKSTGYHLHFEIRGAKNPF